MRTRFKLPLSVSLLLLPLLFVAVTDAQDIQSFSAQRRAERLQQEKGIVVRPRVTSPASQATAPVVFPQNREETQRIAVIRQAEPAVASVIISKDLPVMERYYQTIQLPNGMAIQIPQVRQNGTQSQEVGAGTAFFVSPDGLLLTNNHVVIDANASYTVLTNDGRRLDAKVVSTDASKDIAVLKVDAANTPYLQLGDSANLELGQTAIAIGNALGEYRNTVSVGVISGLERSITAQVSNTSSESISGLIQTDAAINLGNSGGPLLGLRGQVIGMNTAIASDGQNIGFAIPSNDLQAMLSQYR